MELKETKVLPREGSGQVVREVCLPYGFIEAGREICSRMMDIGDAAELALRLCDMAKLLAQS